MSRSYRSTKEGAWTLRATGQTRKSPTTSTLKAIPTKTHMSLVALQQKNILKCVVSQNTDGLHRKSGIPPEKLAELHGNSNKETCIDCKKEFIRDFRGKFKTN
jgi:mono-ADP-ribosyltransferase sirtuin 6